MDISESTLVASSFLLAVIAILISQFKDELKKVDRIEENINNNRSVSLTQHKELSRVLYRTAFPCMGIIVLTLIALLPCAIQVIVKTIWNCFGDYDAATALFLIAYLAFFALCFPVIQNILDIINLRKRVAKELDR